MPERRDKLGRRIPEFDRSAAGRKSAKTTKEKYGLDKYKRARAIAGSRSKRGYFGTLKDAGKDDELKALSKKAHQAQKKNREKAQRNKDSVPNG